MTSTHNDDVDHMIQSHVDSDSQPYPITVFTVAGSFYGIPGVYADGVLTLDRKNSPGSKVDIPTKSVIAISYE